MHPVFIQAFYYGIVMVLMAFFVGLFQRGFFWKYFKVRTSFGKYVLVKVKAINRDYFEIGTVEGKFLIYTHKIGGKEGKQEKRIGVENSSCFYRALSVTWVDVDDEKNAILNPNADNVNGFDAVKYNDLYLRALYRPSINDSKEKLILVLLLIIALGVIVSFILGWMIYSKIPIILEAVQRGTINPAVI